MRHDYSVGDKIIFHSPSKYKEALKSRVEGKIKRINMNSAKALYVAGFYHVRDRRLDEQFIIIHQDSANEMLSYDWGTATQIEITLDNPYQSKEIINKLKLDPKFAGFNFTPWQDQSKGIYKRIVQEKSQMYFVLFLIMGAAGIGIGASIFSLVIQKTKEIGILKSIGANPFSIIIIFISQGAFIGVLGSLLGYLTGITIIKNTDSIITFLGSIGAQMGQLRSIPMKLDNADVQFILWGAIGICLLAAIIPAIIAATVNPVKALQSGN
jgi:lipoprotein-releasing system permease protein